MKRWLATLILTCAAAAAAQAQYPGSPYGGYGQPGFTPDPYYQPNIYNRATQPLSPYLNLLRGGSNPAADYYFGVRPGLQSGGQPLGGQFGRPGTQGSLNNSQMRTGYLPQAAYQTPEPIPLPDADRDVILSPSGHSVIYGNTFGISRTGIPNASTNRPGFFAPPTTGSAKQPPPKK